MNTRQVVSVAVTLSVVMTAVRCPRGAWLTDKPGAVVVNVRPIPDRHTHDGRGEIHRCRCVHCRGRFYSLVSYAVG